LPGEREYEAAARYGRWREGSEMGRVGEGTVNTWQGAFPGEDSGTDGHVGTAPVTAYGSRAGGFYNLVGNVWEWVRGGKGAERFVRGASYADSVGGEVNHAATAASRSHVAEETSSCNIGFRCAKGVQRDGASGGGDGTKHTEKGMRYGHEL